MNIGGGEAWIKFEAGTRVRPGEEPTAAAERVSDAVDAWVTQKAQDLRDA